MSRRTLKRGMRARCPAVPPGYPPALRAVAGKEGAITALPRLPPIDRAAFLPDGAERGVWLPVALLVVGKRA